MRYLGAVGVAVLCGFFTLAAFAASYSVKMDYYADPADLLKKAQDFTVYAYFGPKNPNQDIYGLVLDPKNDNFEIGVKTPPEKDKRYDFYWDVPDEKTLESITKEIKTHGKDWYLYNIRDGQGSIIGYLISPLFSNLYLHVEGGKYIIDEFRRPDSFHLYKDEGWRN